MEMEFANLKNGLRKLQTTRIAENGSEQSRVGAPVERADILGFMKIWPNPQIVAGRFPAATASASEPIFLPSLTGHGEDTSVLET